MCSAICAGESANAAPEKRTKHANFKRAVIKCRINAERVFIAHALGCSLHGTRPCFLRPLNVLGVSVAVVMVMAVAAVA
jgi:hypothetical protein